MPSEAHGRQHLLRARWLRWTLAGSLVVLAALGALIYGICLWRMRRAEPQMRAILVQALQQRFGSRVEIDAFHFSLRGAWFSGVWPSGSMQAEFDGLRIWLPDAAGQAQQSRSAQPWLAQPWIAIDHLRFAATPELLHGGSLRIRNVQIDGVRLRIPPRGFRPRLAAPAPASGGSHLVSPHLVSAPRIVVEQITCTHVWLEMERASGPTAVSGPLAAPAQRLPKPRAGTPLAVTASSAPVLPSALPAAQPVFQPARQPLQFSIAGLILRPDPAHGPIRFDLQMTNPRPVGQIHATGVVGPWPQHASGAEFDPGALPLSGSYSFDHADLATLHGIAGTLCSTGSFRGILRQVEVSGQTSTPDFRLTRHGAVPPASVGLPLETRFAATVDGTNGDTVLHAVEATLGRSHLWASGRVLRVEYRPAEPAQPSASGQPAALAIGHDIQLALRVDRGQIADLLQAATADPSPLVTGDVTLTSALHLPPGPESFRERLWLSGRMQASGVHFTSERVEREITQLSLRGQGHPEALRSGPPAPVASAMTGDFTFADGVLALPDLVWQVPGAQIHVHGTYTLEGGALDFSGDARMQAALSQLVGGWRGLLLSPLNRVFAKNGAGTDVPIRLSGTRAEPHFAIELSRLGRIEPASAPADAPSAQQQPGTQPAPQR